MCGWLAASVALPRVVGLLLKALALILLVAKLPLSLVRVAWALSRALALDNAPGWSATSRRVYQWPRHCPPGELGRLDKATIYPTLFPFEVWGTFMGNYELCGVRAQPLGAGERRRVLSYVASASKASAIGHP